MQEFQNLFSQNDHDIEHRAGRFNTINQSNKVRNEFPKSVLKMHTLLILYNFNSQSDKTTLDLQLYLDDAVKDKDEADQNQKAG